MKRPKKEKQFATEAELCAAFIKALPDGWTSYAETQSWDILLVRDDDGFQIGVQAKLKLNVDVINQAIEDGSSWREHGPDCRAVLVPDDAGHGFGKICDYVGLTVIRMKGEKGYRPAWHRGFSPELPKRSNWHQDWHEMAPTHRHKLPEYVPDVAAGAPSPLQLTEWKIKAIKIAVLLEEDGSVTRKDFAHLRLDHRRWVAAGWLKTESGGYVGNAMPDFRAQHPVVYAKIRADLDKWRPPRNLVDMAKAPIQAAMF